MNDEEYIIEERELGNSNCSFDLASLDIPDLALFSVRQSAFEYDESEGVSESSIASDSCKSSKSHHAKPKLGKIQGSGGVADLARRPKSVIAHSKTESTQIKDLHNRIRILEQENSLLVANVRKFEGAHGKLRMRKKRLGVSVQLAANIPGVFTVVDDSSVVCDSCAKYAVLVNNMGKANTTYSSIVRECERLGDELTEMTKERNRLKLLLKTNKSHQAQLKETQSENDTLREALKQRHPNTAFALLSSVLPPQQSPADERVRQLEETLTRIDEQWVRRLNTLRDQHQQIKTQYEGTIHNLAVGPAPRVVELEARIESMKEFMKLKKNNVTLRICSSAIVAITNKAVGETTMNDWRGLLASCMSGRDELAKSLLGFDPSHTGLITRSSFVRCLSDLEYGAIEQLVDIYAYGDEQIDYKTFLSDLAARAGVFATDLELENKTLRTHVQALMNELNDKMDSIETGELMETLQTANDQLLKKENELARIKLQVNRLTRSTNK